MPKVTKTNVGLDVLNLDTKENCVQDWKLYADDVQVASGSQTLGPLEYKHWWQALPWQKLAIGGHSFRLEITNANGVNNYTSFMYVLIGDVDNNNIVNMLDLYKTAIKFGQTSDIPGLQNWINEDIDRNGVINMLDLYICAVKFGATC